MGVEKEDWRRNPRRAQPGTGQIPPAFRMSIRSAPVVPHGQGQWPET